MNFLEIFWSERVGEKVTHLEDLRLPASIAHHNVDIARQVHNNLPACPTGRYEPPLIRNDGNGLELLLPFRNSLENGGSFGTNRQPVRAHFNVAALVDPPTSGE